MFMDWGILETDCKEIHAIPIVSWPQIYQAFILPVTHMDISHWKVYAAKGLH